MNFPFLPSKKNVFDRAVAVRKRTTVLVKHHPLRTFFGLLGLLLLLIIMSNIIARPSKEEKKPTPPVKTVNVYQVGGVPRLSVQAQIEKSGVIHIVALTSGVVDSIDKKEGQTFDTHETLLELATNYKGGNAPKLQRQLAETQLSSSALTYQLQKEIIKKQKELADRTDTNNDDLRKITEQSIGETRDLITLNEDILHRIDDNIAELEANNPGGINDPLILAAKQLKSQFLAATNAQRSALRNSEYQSSSDNPPAQISDLQREITKKQLELQEKTLALNVEIARIQVRIAQVQEGIMYPSAPFPGTVQRVFVKVGETVSPGKELMVVSEATELDPVVAIAYVPNEVARKISTFEQTALHIGNTTIYGYPSFVTSEAVQGGLYGVYFDIPDNYSPLLTEKGFIQVDLPIGYYDTGSTMPFLPIDAVYQTQDKSYIFIIKNGHAESREVVLGQVYGSFVEVVSGLNKGDQVILDRTIIAGDKVEVSR